MTVSRLDQLYRSILVSKFFTKGWGKPENIKRLYEIQKSLKDRNHCYSLVSKTHPIQIDKEEEQSDCFLLNGQFKSPFALQLPGVVPKESETAYFQMILPKKWKTPLRPVCLHLAGTGDHYFWRRRTFMAKPLLKEYGIASIILENPFYGARKPKDQVRSNLHNVSDIFVMGGCLMLESIALFNWCERQGLGPLGLTGISMGGHMACISAGVWPKPLVLVPCLSWTTASCVFTQGVMSTCIPWRLLQNQYFSNEDYHDDLRKLIGPYNNLSTASKEKNFNQQFDKNASEVEKLKTLKDNGLDVLNFSAELSSTQMLSPSETASARLNSLLQFPRNEKSTAEPKNKSDDNSVMREAYQFMNSIMDQFTHLANYASPVDTSLVIIIAAKDDAYVLREGVEDLTQLWKGAELRMVNSGHVAAFIFNQSLFRRAIYDGFNKLIEKHNLGEKQPDLQLEKQV